MKARLPQGYGGGPQNQKDAMRQAQKMQEMFAQLQEELDAREFTATSGGGMVEVTMTGKKELKAIKINPEIVDPDDVEMLEDVIMAAVNEVIKTVEETSNEEMSKVTGGFNIPGLGGLL